MNHPFYAAVALVSTVLLAIGRPTQVSAAAIDGWTDLTELLAAEEPTSVTPDGQPLPDSAVLRQIPRNLIPVTIEERLHTLRTRSDDELILTETASDVAAKRVVEAVDDAFQDQYRIPESAGNAVVAGEAAQAAGQIAAELLDAPIPDDDVDFQMPRLRPLDPVFEAAVHAYENKDATTLSELAVILRDGNHELRDYAVLWSLSLRLERDRTDPEAHYEMQRFIALHDGDYLGEAARTAYLKLAGSALGNEAFDKILAEIRWNQNDPEIRAWKILGDMAAARRPKTVHALLVDAQKLWRDALNVRSPAFLELNRMLLHKDRTWAWRRVLLLMQKHRWSEARLALQDVPRPELPAPMTELIEILEQPIGWYNRQRALSNISARLGVFAVLRLLKAQPAAAVELASSIEPKLSAFWKSFVWSMIGYEAATNLDPQAFDHYRRAGSAIRQDPLLIAYYDSVWSWKARSALRTGNWYSLGQIIAQLPENIAEEETWLYWKGRAYAERGLHEQARKTWSRLTSRMSFYGKLACDELRVPYVFGKAPASIRADELERWRSNPSLLRAEALYRMHFYREGHREWNWATAGLHGRDFVVLAAYAKERHLIHRMINTSMRSGRSIVDLRQRYPMPYFELVHQLSRGQNIPPAWVYGLIRQESRFIPGVSSHVGARGLMQVMPQTAEWIAHQVGVANYARYSLRDMELNLLIGTAYLRMLYADLSSNFVVATAAYNAGPAKARVWRALLTQPMEAAIFIETIPYYETRGYVKNVLANMHTYAHRLHQPIKRFKAFLGEISPGSTAASALP